MADGDLTHVLVRTAEQSDASRLIAIRSEVVEHDLDTDEFVHHLGIPHGDDYFCLTAEVKGEVVGYLSAGGSRDDDHKSYGEFYELAVDPTCDLPVRRRLCDEAFSMLVEAQYGGVIAWVPDGDAGFATTVEALGFTSDDREREHRSHQRRLGIVLAPPTRQER